MGIFDGLTTYSDQEFSRFLRGTFLASAGYDEQDLSRPIVAIAHTISDYATCHRGMPELVAAVSRGVLEAGGLPMVVPTMSLPEVLVAPTSMLYRNLLAMATEETLRSHPMDAVVLVGGCDKTVPAQIMAAVSADVPFVQLVVGPMLTGSLAGERIGACSDCRRFWAEYRGGTVSRSWLEGAGNRLATTSGTCMVMGTASTMAALAEVLGVAIRHSATAPSPTGDRLRIGLESGRVAVEAARRDRRPSRYLTHGSFRNAATVLCALGGSTNAVLHLLAIAGRAEIDLTLDQIGQTAAKVPVLVDCKPAGTKFLEDLHYAGGLPAVLSELRNLLHLDAEVVEGGTLGQRLATPGPPPDVTRVVRTADDPVAPGGGLVVLKGSLAPRGAVLKLAGMDPALRRHRGPALVFDSPEDASQRLNDPDLAVTREHVLVLRNIGPIAAGMPEAGSLPIPVRLARAGVRDMVRVSDGRMSGTASGTVVLHVTPEAAARGPLALVADGDLIELDVDAARLDLCVAPHELEHRSARLRPMEGATRGWRQLYARTVLQADQGADLDFLVGRR
jgi:dihydroxy-acid dehydratase